MQLKDILALGNAAKRRAELRRVATPVFDGWSGRVAAAIGASPICGDGAMQINVRPTVSGLRDALSEDVLWGLVTGEITVEQVLDAVQDPGMHGTSSAGAKTSFAFGQPRVFDATRIGDMWSELNRGSHPALSATITTTTASKEEPMTDMQKTITDISLEALINTVDGVLMRNLGWDLVDVRFALNNLGGNTDAIKARVGGMEAAIMARGTMPSVQQEPHHPALALAIADNIRVTKGGTPTPVAKGGMAKVAPEHEAILNAVLSAAKLPPINELIGKLNDATADVIRLNNEVIELAKKPSASVVLMPTGTTVAAAASGTLPAGKVVTKPAYEVFGIKKGMSFDFDVPVWEWDHAHPYVPERDDDYIFRPKELLSALYSLISGDRAWASGHTGTGKTTLWEQIGARLNWPVRVLSFDSEVTRADLIGQHILINDGGVTISKFVEGILPWCLQQPIILVCDELDFIRPDVAYVMQRVAEAKGMTLTEDGGRLVQPHVMFRLVATANTEGQGDDYGMYAGARVQSAAFLDRFTNWIRVDYLTAEQRLNLLKKKVPHLDDPTAEQVNKYTTEHIEAFKNAKVMKPISPRGMIALGTRIANYLAIMPAKARKEAITQALESAILNACTQQDRAVLKGISDRVFV